MADNQILTPSLQAVASPVDRFVAPTQDNSGSGLAQLARGLSTLNPKLQSLISTQYERNAERDFAQGQAMGDQLDPGFALEENKTSWRQLIESTRKSNPEMADQMVGASPHFRAGLVKAKAERVALGLDDHLSRLWEENAGGVLSMDDPQQVMGWLQKQTEAYNEKMGVSSIDPVMLASTYRPRAMQAQDVILNKHMTYRSKARVAEYENEFSAGIGYLVNGGGNANSSERDFISRLRGSESSGNNRAHRTNRDGRSFTGGIQMGQARLNEYMDATGTKFTMAEFNKSDALQDMVSLWHIRDIDKMIDENGYLGMGYSRDGLRAVAHLGGKEGMRKFVSSGGGYNPSDELGTSLGAYYSKFSNNASQIQQKANEAIANGIAPAKVNEMTVDALIAQAKATNDPTILDVLDQISAGSGPLGNIAWVKEARVKAQDEIEDELWETQQRERTLEENARADAAREIRMTGYEQVFSDPFADHSQLQEAAIASGNPALAKELHDLGVQLQNETYKVPTNHEVVAAQSFDIFRGERAVEDILSDIQSSVGVDYPSSVAQSLMDDLRVSQENVDWIRDSEFRNVVNTTTSIIHDRTHQTDIVSGNVVVSGEEKAMEAEGEMIEEAYLWLAQNEDLPAKQKKLAFRKHMRTFARTVLKEEAYQQNNGLERPVDTTAAESRVEEPAIAQSWEDAAREWEAATGEKLTGAEFAERYGSE